MTSTNQHPILTQAQAYMDAKGLTNADLSRLIGVSQSVMSQLFQNKYPGNVEEVLRKIEVAIGKQSQDWKLFETANHLKITKVCEDAQADSRMMAIHGETGMGKTTSLMKYVSKTPNTYYVLADVLMKPKDLIKTIQRAVGSQEEGTVSERALDICSKLLSKSKPLLIIDDAGKLKEHPKCFYLLQLIYDRTEGRCGIVVSGTEAFTRYIDKQANKDVMGFRELRRRISFWQDIQPRTDLKFIRAACKVHGITLEGAINYIHRVCVSYGDVKEIITNYKRYKQLHGEIEQDRQQNVLSELKFNQFKKS